jgi:excisionase family DNA binding protein
MPRDEEPLTFSVQEVARAMGVSDETVRRMLHTPFALEGIKIGKRILPTRQGVADYWTRALDAADPRRKELEADEAVIAKQQAEEQRAYNAERERIRQYGLPENVRARYRKEEQDKLDRDVDSGAAGTRDVRRKRILGPPHVARLDPNTAEKFDIPAGIPVVTTDREPVLA